MSPVINSKKRRSVFFGIGLAVLIVLFGPSLRAQAPNPVPLINLPLVPDATAPGGPQFTLTVNGTGFVSNSTVNWNTTPLATTFVSRSQLTAVVPAADIAKASTGWVTVVNPAPGGGTSNVAFLSVSPDSGYALYFTNTTAGSGGEGTTGVVVSDFNGDGKLDMAVANGGSNTVSILLGDGTGNFTVVSSPAVNGSPLSLTVGDFNRDGKPDLAVTVTGSISILLGNGDGTFQPPLVLSFPAISQPYQTAAADFNGDGNLDLAVASYGNNTVVILLGDGTGNFTVGPTSATGENPVAVAVGDFNGDGIPDLAVANYGSATLSILLGDGTGNFSLASSPGTDLGPASVAVGDFNGDGWPDLAVATQEGGLGNVSILLGDGTGNFIPDSSQGTGWYTDSLAVGDLNGDGKLDLAVKSECMYGGCDAYHGGTYFLVGDGTGDFFMDVWTQWSWGYWFTFQPSSIALGDFNGDGAMDVAATFWYLNGVGLALQIPPAPSVSLTPSSLDFGTQLIFTSAQRSVTLSNGGNAALSITSINTSGNFSQTNDCGSIVLADEYCQITVSFSPSTIGTQTGTLTITDNASNSPQTVPLTGAGTIVALAPTSLGFSAQTVGTTSAPQTVTLTNSGRRPLTIAGIHIAGADSGDFAETNTCGTSVAPGSSCTISVTFTPQAKGVRQAVIGVSDNGGGAPQTVGLRGYGK